VEVAADSDVKFYLKAFVDYFFFSGDQNWEYSAAGYLPVLVYCIFLPAARIAHLQSHQLRSVFER